MSIVKLVLKTGLKRLIMKYHDEYRSKILHVDRLLNVWHALPKIMVKARNVILMLDTVMKALSILIQMQKKFRKMFIFIITYLKTTPVRLDPDSRLPSIVRDGPVGPELHVVFCYPSSNISKCMDNNNSCKRSMCECDATFIKPRDFQ